MRKSLTIACVFTVFVFLVGLSCHADKGNAGETCGFCSLSFDYSQSLISDIVPALCETSIATTNESHANPQQVALSCVPDRAPPAVS